MVVPDDERRGEMKLVYFDMNAMIRLKEDLELRKEVTYLLGQHHLVAPYSSAHLEEERHRMMEEQAAYIAFLDDFTQMWELRPIDDFRMCVLLQEPSRCCMERVKRDDGVSVTDDVEQADLAFMRHIRENDEARRMSAKELSSIPPDRIFEKMQYGDLYRQRIADFHSFWGWSDDAVRHTFAEFQHQAAPKAGYRRWNVLEHYIATMMEFLNAIPYHQDRLAKTKGSMTHDVTHAIYGAFCDFFVTDDKKLSYRLEALYHWMEVSVEVMGLQGFWERLARSGKRREKS